jgi:hypothetical protein
MNWPLILTFWSFVFVVAALVGWTWLIILLLDANGYGNYRKEGWRKVGVAAWYVISIGALTLLLGLVPQH